MLQTDAMNVQEIRAVAAEFAALSHETKAGRTLAQSIAAWRAALPYSELVAHLHDRDGFHAGPDIVNLGPPRTGSSWLFWHLYLSVDNVTKIHGKEINFLLTYCATKDCDALLDRPDGLAWWQQYRQGFARQFDHWLDIGLLDITVWQIILLIGARDWAWYQLLTGAVGGNYGIDYSPNNLYAPATVYDTLRSRAPAAKLFCILRDPLERATSYFRHLGAPSLIDDRVIHTALFGYRLAEIARTFGTVHCFQFSELQRNAEVFMLDFCKAFDLVWSYPRVPLADLHNAGRGDYVPTFTQRAKTLLLEDTEYLRAFAGDNITDTWLRKIEQVTPA